MRVSIIAAIGKNRELGKNNKLLWYIPEDFKRFKELTGGHPIIMGRKTFESIGRALPNRTNIIITRDDSYKKEGTIIVHSLNEALGQAKEILKQVQNDNEREVFVIGGGQIYKQAISIADKLYLTVVDARFDADTFFPDYSRFKKVVFEERGKSGKYKYKFLDLER